MATPAKAPATTVDIPAAPERATITLLDPSKDVRTVPLLNRLLMPKRMKVSAVTLDCLKRLRYSPGTEYRQKAPGKDFSEVLRPLELFVETFLKTLKQVQMTSEFGENESSLRAFLSANLPKIRASDELKGFFASWNIKVIAQDHRSPSPIDAELDIQLRLAMDASRVTARREREHGEVQEVHNEEMDEEAAEHSRKALLSELDAINLAVQHRLVRWAAKAPKRRMVDQLWPTTFSTEERKSIRKYVTNYIDEHDWIETDMAEQDKVNAVRAMQDDDEFPVAMARTAAVIQAALLEMIRLGKIKHDRSQSEVTRSPSRTQSPAKRVPRKPADAAEESEEEEEEEEPVSRGWKRQRATAFAADDEEFDEEDDDDAYADHESRDPKRARRRGSRAKKIAKSIIGQE